MRKTHGFFLAAALALVVAACSDDESGAGDTGGDGGGDARDVTDGTDTTDTAETAPDVESEPDLPTGTGTISGAIFNNTATTNGNLTIGLVRSVPVVGAPVRTTVFGSPSAPNQPYELRDVPLGTYYVVALWDVGANDTFESPGEGDLFGATAEPIGLVTNGQVMANVNLEVE